MEKGEPNLVPEWLKSNGSKTTGSSLSSSDNNSSPGISRNKSFLTTSHQDLGRFTGSDRTTSSYFRRSSSSNGSRHLNSYNSFGRNQRDRGWEKDLNDSRDKDKILGGHRQVGISDSPRSNAVGIFDREMARRSQSAISGRHADTRTMNVATAASNTVGNNNNGLCIKGVLGGGAKKAMFERNFPRLEVEEKAFIPEILRIPSPGVSSAFQSLPIGTSTMIGGEKWTSALAEVPLLVGSSGIGTSSVQPAASTPLASGIGTSLNMAEAIAQSPTRVSQAPELSAGHQRLDELAIKQSRQLIPVLPSVPKNLVLNSSDKQKSKLGQQHPLPSTKIDTPKASNTGKLHVLNPMREKNVTVKDNLSPTGSSIPSSTLLVAPHVSGSAVAKEPPINQSTDQQTVTTFLEKRSTSQARSRKEFFSLLRKKSMTNSSSVSESSLEIASAALDVGTVVAQPLSEKLEDVLPAPVIQIIDSQLNESLSGHHLAEARDDSTCTDDARDTPNYFDNGNQHSIFESQFSEEKEEAFLRSLGWEENSDEGGLTEEEINAFLKETKNINSKPAFKVLQGVQHKFILPNGSMG